MEAGGAFGAIAFDPLARGPRADACGSCGGLRRLPAQHFEHDTLSTARRQTGIVMNVHPVPRESLKLRNSSFLGRGRVDNLMEAHS